MRRWNGNGGGRRWGPVFQVTGAVSSGKVAVPAVGGTAPTFAGFETDLRDVDASQFGGSAPAAETDFGGAQCVPGAGPSRSDPKCGQREVPTFHVVQLHSLAVQLLCFLEEVTSCPRRRTL